MHCAPPEPRTTARREVVVLSLVALLCVVWGSTWWGIKLCLADQPPLCSAAMRFWLASVSMALLAPLLRRVETGPPPPSWLWITSGVTNFATTYGIIYVVEQHMASGIAAVLWSIFPLLMAASAVLFLGERLRARQLLGFVVSFAGIVVVSAGDLGGGTATLGSALLLLVSPLSSATGTTLVKKFGSGTSSVLLNRNGMLLGAALLSVAALLAEDPAAIVWTTNGVLALGYLAVFGTALTFGVYFWLLRTAPASLLSTISFVTPILAMLLSALVGDGELALRDWAGTALVATGVALVVVRARR